MHGGVRTNFLAIILLSVTVLINVMDCLCSVRELTARTRSVVTGFGPPGKFRAGGNGDLFIYSLAGGEVEMKNGGKYRCNKQIRWEKISLQQGLYYRLYTIPVRPEHAEAVCSEEGGELATVYNTTESWRR